MIAYLMAVGGSAYTIELLTFDQAGTALAMAGTERCGDDSDGCNLSRAYEALRPLERLYAEAPDWRGGAA